MDQQLRVRTTLGEELYLVPVPISASLQTPIGLAAENLTPVDSISTYTYVHIPTPYKYTYTL